MDLDGRIALVTAGSRGIGAGISRALGRRGAAVAVNYHRNADAAASVVAEIESSGSRAVAVGADVTDDDVVREVVARVERELGTIDVLVCNSIGSTSGLAAMRGRSALDAIDPILDVTASQLRATLHAVRHVVPGMRERGGGSIVIIGAGSTHASRTPAALPHLTVAKKAQDGLAHVLAAELGPDGIRVNVVGPGFVPTDANAGPMQDEARTRVASLAALGRVPSADDVGETVAAVAGPAFGMTTGGFVVVDGGVTML